MARSTASRRSITYLSLIAVLFSTVVLAVRPEPVRAAAIAVTITPDGLHNDGDCSVRAAIRAASLDQAIDRCPAWTGADRVTTPAGHYIIDIGNISEDAAGTGDFDITSDVTLVGVNSAAFILDGNDVDRCPSASTGRKEYWYGR